MGVNELRERFLSFFESKGHLRAQSASLVPQNDNSLLLINSGMAPLKNYFLGVEKPPKNRLTTCQKCIRTPDIEQVGKTSRHGTFFEMLGNFSFGDYFKEEATQWAWEFFLEELGIPEDKIWVTIYEDDDEAYDIWTQHRGVNPARVVRMGKEDNFWEIGSGPCGPCSEIYIDRGEEYTCNAPECGIGKCDCDRYMEVWNLVFTQFDSDGNGTYTPLEHPNIDTGMGLERLACVMQGVDNLFEVDTVQNIMAKISERAGVTYHSDSKSDISLRVITDHIRSTVFMVGDGILPSNEGRGYVLRRLLRRAARHGRLLGINEPFLYYICDTVIEENKGQYPELDTNREYIKTVVLAEEERFTQTIEQGMEMLSELLDHISAKALAQPILNGEDVFRLYDTFGFPIDLTREIAQEHGITIDEEGFLSQMRAQRDRARKAQAEKGGIGWEEDVLAALDLKDDFVGYDHLQIDTTVLELLVDGALVEEVAAGQQATILLKKTPFYAESGGQIGDKGVLKAGDTLFEVVDCRKSPTGHFLHVGTVLQGNLQKGQAVTAVVDRVLRYRIMANHSATHLLHAGLRAVLGEHVHQAGSYVDAMLTRFDFTHFSAVTPEQLLQVELFVNDQIMRTLPVSTTYMPIEEAKKYGAMALFGDKYNDIVRVCQMGNASIELCGGTHVGNTSQIGVFKILSESSVAAGVRRIEATTGMGVLDFANTQQALLGNLGGILKANGVSELLPRAMALVERGNDLEKQAAQLERKLAELKTQDLENALEPLGDLLFIAKTVASPLAPLQERADKLKEQHPNLVGIFAAVDGDSATLLVFAGKEALAAGIHAGKLVKEITALAGGNGGGRPDNAKGGLPQQDRIESALAQAKHLVEGQLNA